MVLQHLHPGEQLVQVRRDDVLERYEPLLAEGDEAREDRRDLDPGEVLLPGVRVADGHRQIERKTGDVGERVGGVDRERCEHREHPVGEELLHALHLVGVELVPPQQENAAVGQGGEHVVAEHLSVPAHQLPRLGPDAFQHFSRHHPAR